jgi:hypothetical protein
MTIMSRKMITSTITSRTDFVRRNRLEEFDYDQESQSAAVVLLIVLVIIFLLIIVIVIVLVRKADRDP